MSESGPVDPNAAGPAERFAPDPAPLPNWSESWAVRGSSPVQPATAAPIVATPVPQAVQVPPLLIRRQLQLIETYETFPGVSPVIQQEATELAFEIGTDATTTPQASAAAEAAEANASVEPSGPAGASADTSTSVEASTGAEASASPATVEPVPAEPDRAELLHELEVTRSELAELSQLVEELPAIFERKFRQRLEPILEEQSRLQADNLRLRQQLEALPGGSQGRPLLLPTLAESPGSAPPHRRARGLGGMLQRAFGFSDRDDGRTTAA